VRLIFSFLTVGGHVQLVKWLECEAVMGFQAQSLVNWLMVNPKIFLLLVIENLSPYFK